MAQHRLISTTTILLSAAAIGVAAGVGPQLMTSSGQQRVVGTLRPVAIAAGIKREREPQPGDYWRGCNDARAAGTAPIFDGEPGYRSGMDGDSDGIACEPYRG